MINLKSLTEKLYAFPFQLPRVIADHVSKIGNAARAVFGVMGTAAAVGYETARRKVTAGTFSLDETFKATVLAELGQARAQAAQAGATGFLAGFALLGVAYVMIDRYTTLFMTKERTIKNILAKSEAEINGSAATRQELDALGAIFDLPWIQKKARDPAGAQEIKELLCRQNLWSSKVRSPQYVELLNALLDEGKLDCTVILLEFFYKKDWNDELIAQFDLVEPTLRRIAGMREGKEAIKTILNQNAHPYCKFLSYQGMFAKVKAFIDFLVKEKEQAFFTLADWRDLLIARYVDTGFNGRTSEAVIESPEVFAAAMPWLEQMASDEKEGRQMVLELLRAAHPETGRTPLHNPEIVPLAIQLFGKFQPTLTDEEMRPLFLAKKIVLHYEDIFAPPTKIERPSFYNISLFLFVQEMLLRFIEKEDEEVIKYTKSFMKYAGDINNKTINLLDPEVFVAAKPLIEALVEQKQLILSDIEVMFTRCKTPDYYDSRNFPRISGTLPAPIFNLQHFEWILSLCEQLQCDKREVCHMLKKFKNDTDLTALHTPGALAIAKPHLPDLTLWKKLKLLFEAGSWMTTHTGAKSLSEEEFYPVETTIFERNLEDAKKWIEESNPTDEEIVDIRRCIQGWIGKNQEKVSERQAMVADWALLKN